MAAVDIAAAEKRTAQRRTLHMMASIKRTRVFSNSPGATLFAFLRSVNKPGRVRWPKITCCDFGHIVP